MITETASFDAATAVSRIGERTYRAELLPEWTSLVGVHGGYTAAIASRAILETIDDTTRQLRSLATQFVSSPRPGPATVEVNVERSGRTATFATARVTQGDRLRLLTTAFAGHARGGPVFDDRRSPQVAVPPPGLHRIAPPPEVVPVDQTGHFANSELVLDPDTVPFIGGDQARLAGWMRPLAGERAGATWLVCVCDFFPPAVFARLTKPVPAATIDYTVHLLVPDVTRHVEPGDYVYAEMTSSHSAGGYAVEEGIVWAPDGTTIATSHQLRLAG